MPLSKAEYARIIVETLKPDLIELAEFILVEGEVNLKTTPRQEIDALIHHMIYESEHPFGNGYPIAFPDERAARLAAQGIQESDLRAHGWLKTSDSNTLLLISDILFAARERIPAPAAPAPQ